MFLPLNTNRPLRRPTVVVPLLILFNVFAYGMMMARTHGDEEAVGRFFQEWGFTGWAAPSRPIPTPSPAPAATPPPAPAASWALAAPPPSAADDTPPALPGRTVSPQDLQDLRDAIAARTGAAANRGPAVTVWTYMFVHADLLHLVGNMLFLWIFGPSVEDRFGKLGFLIFYALAGVAAASGAGLFEHTPPPHTIDMLSNDGTVQTFRLPDGLAPPRPIVGASGAIAGVTGAYMVLFPRTLVRVLVFFIVIGMYEIPALWFILASFAKDVVLNQTGDRGVAYEAHISGTIFGFAVALFLLITHILGREDFDLFYIFQQKKRLAQLRAATRELDPATGVPRRVLAPARRRDEPPPPSEEAMAARSDIGAAVSRRDWPAAAEALSRFDRLTQGPGGRIPMARRLNSELANGLYAAGLHAAAAEAYTRYLADHRPDAQTPHVRLLLAALYARHLGLLAKAAAVLKEIPEADLDGEDLTLLRALRAEVGVAPTPPPALPPEPA